MRSASLKICKYLLLYVLLFSSGHAGAQDWKKDMLEMNKIYMDASSFSMDINVQSFAGINDPKPMFDYAGQVVSKEDNYYASMMGRITVTNKRCVLVVDNPQKMIMYKKMTDDVKPKNGFSLANIDSAIVLMGKNVTVNYLQNDAKEKRIVIIYKDGNIAKTEIAIDPVSHIIKEIVYYYKNDTPDNQVAKVVITYKNVELNKNIPDSFFSENNYVAHKKDSVVPLKKYESYQVVNQNHL